MPRISVLYATPVAMPPTLAAFAGFPGAQVINVLDEGLLRLVLDAGEITAQSSDRLVTHLQLAADADSDAMLVTCNIYSNVVAAVRDRFASMPIIAVDEPMVERAVLSGQRIAVLATGISGLRSQVTLLRDTAARLGREVTLVEVLREEAFAALTAGDGDRHDEIVLDAIAAAETEGVDVMVLAQASMARVLATGKVDSNRVLSSPALAVAELRRVLAA